jgi:hypothetical protein
MVKRLVSSVADPGNFSKDPDPRILIFSCDPQDVKKRENFLSTFFCIIFLKVNLYHFKKKVIKKSPNSRNQCFLTIFAGDRRIRTRISDKWIRIREAQKHWLRQFLYIFPTILAKNANKGVPGRIPGYPTVTVVALQGPASG